MPWCLVFVQKVNFREKHQKRSQTSYFTRRLTEPEGEKEMGHEWPKPQGGAAKGPTAPATEESDSATSPSPPFDYLTLSDLKREGVVHFIQKHLRTPPPSRNLFRDQKLRSGTPPGRGIGGDHRHHHHRRFSIDHPCFPHPCVSNSPL